MATRNSEVERFYDPADLDPSAPRLYIRANRGTWELRDADGGLLLGSANLPDAIDAALARSAQRFSEILVRGSSGKNEWSVHHNPQWMHLARLLNQTVRVEQEAAD